MADDAGDGDDERPKNLVQHHEVKGVTPITKSEPSLNCKTRGEPCYNEKQAEHLCLTESMVDIEHAENDNSRCNQHCAVMVRHRPRTLEKGSKKTMSTVTGRGAKSHSNRKGNTEPMLRGQMRVAYFATPKRIRGTWKHRSISFE